MRKSFCYFLFLLCISPTVFGQLIGTYADSFGERLTFHANGTFEHEWHFDLAGGWTNGTWRLSKDTIYLRPVLVLDTLTRPDQPDSLVLSMDKKAQRIDNLTYVGSLISGGGQYRRKPPRNLYYEKGKLYLIKSNGRLDTSRRRGFWTDKTYPSWFEKMANSKQ